MERLHIDEQLRQFGGGPTAAPRMTKDKHSLLDNGVDPGSSRGAARGQGQGGEALMVSGMLTFVPALEAAALLFLLNAQASFITFVAVLRWASTQ